MEEKYTYSMTINIAYPSVEAPKQFSEVANDLKTAINKFNEKFAGKKQLKIEKMKETIILLNLTSESSLKNPTREISVFSQILYNEFNWKRFSQKENRMFDVKLVSSPDKEINLSQNIEMKNDTNFFVVLGEIILNCNDTNQLENYIKQLEKLTSMAKSKKELVNIKFD